MQGGTWLHCQELPGPGPVHREPHSVLAAGGLIRHVPACTGAMPVRPHAAEDTHYAWHGSPVMQGLHLDKIRTTAASPAA